jgi:uncharacterized protein (TIGR00661 family)
MDHPGKILITALNWGLGHATRCIPLIRALEQQGYNVVLASDGVAMYLLRAEFPHLKVLELPSYRIQYESHNMVRNIARQLPRILWAIRAEHRATARIVREYGITHVISDNRYGCWNAATRNILLTHQLHLKVNNGLVQWCANALLDVAIRRFDAIWVPDAPAPRDLAGSLAHPPVEHPPVRYIGLLSRMKPGPTDLDYDVAIVLSGPEPQRTILEQRLTEQAIALPYKFIIVQGNPRQKYHHFVSDNVELVSFLTSEELNEVLLRSRVIVCRSGYSSLMDLAVLGKKAVLIPTPGQTEQEYLAQKLSVQGCFFTQHQDNIDLELALEAVENTTGLRLDPATPDDFVALIRAGLAV